jgi:hypothetical protein
VRNMSESEARVALETMCQLFFDGPTWDGNLASKTGRDLLVDLGIAERGHGFQWLTRTGIDQVVMLRWDQWNTGPRITALEAWKRVCAEHQGNPFKPEK